MKKEKFDAGGVDKEARIETALAEAGVPQEYQGFVRNISNLPPHERNSKIQEMAAADRYFADSAAAVDSYLASYDAEHPQSVAEGGATEKPAAPSSEKAAENPGKKLEEWEENFAIEMLASLGIENVDEQEMRDFLEKFREEQKNTGRTAAALIRERLYDSDMVQDFAAKWEAKYGAGAPRGNEPEEEAAPVERSSEDEEKKKRLSEVVHELRALALRTPADPSPRNALDVLDEVRDMSAGDAVRHITEAQKQGHRISKYQAALILHAIIPDRVPRPDISDIKFHEPGYVPKNAVGENSVEQVANEEERPVPGFPEGYVPRKKEAPGEQSAEAVAREERLAEVKRDFEAEGSSSKTLRAALEVLERVRTMTTEEAVPYVINAERNFEILEYHADAILHALIPERVAKPIERTPRAAEETPREEQEPQEEAMSPERRALDQQLKDGIEQCKEAYRGIRGDTASRNVILNGGAEGVKNFLERLNVFTKALRSNLAPYFMKHCELTITYTRETGAANRNIDLNVDDLVSADFETIQQLAEKIRQEIVGEGGPEAESEQPEKKTPEQAENEAPHEQPADYIPPTERRGWGKRVSETASRLADRFGIKNLADSTRIAYCKPLIDWQTRRAVSLKAKLDDKRRAIGVMENNRQHLENELGTFSREGEISGKALAGIGKDRTKIEKEIEKNKNAADRLQSILEYRNNQRARYENRRDEICRGFIARVGERLDPFEAKLSDLKMTRGQLETEIGTYRESLSAHAAKVAQLKKLIDAEQFPSVRKAHRETVKQIERKVKDIASEIKAREKDRGRIDKTIVKQDNKANSLRDKRASLVLITERRGPDTDVEARGRGKEASVEAREVSGHPREAEGGNVGSAETGAAMAERHPESEKKYSGEDLVKKWNSIYGSRIMINPETAAKSFPSLFKGLHSVVEFEDFVGFYGERHGDDERFEGMPSMQKAARKKQGWWKRIFGMGNRRKSQSRLLEALQGK